MSNTQNIDACFFASSKCVLVCVSNTTGKENNEDAAKLNVHQIVRTIMTKRAICLMVLLKVFNLKMGITLSLVLFGVCLNLRLSFSLTHSFTFFLFSHHNIRFQLIFCNLMHNTPRFARVDVAFLVIFSHHSHQTIA